MEILGNLETMKQAFSYTVNASLLGRLDRISIKLHGAIEQRVLSVVNHNLLNVACAGSIAHIIFSVRFKGHGRA